MVNAHLLPTAECVARSALRNLSVPIGLGFAIVLVELEGGRRVQRGPQHPLLYLDPFQ